MNHATYLKDEAVRLIHSVEPPMGCWRARKPTLRNGRLHDRVTLYSCIKGRCTGFSWGSNTGLFSTHLLKFMVDYDYVCPVYPT